MSYMKALAAELAEQQKAEMRKAMELEKASLDQLDEKVDRFMAAYGAVGNLDKYPKFKSAVSPSPKVGAAVDRWRVKHSWTATTKVNLPSQCETDKPIGTRDPDKYLKEQQAALWREMMR